MGSLLNAAALPSLLNAKTVSITVFRAVFHCVVHCAFHNASQRFSVFARCFTGNAKDYIVGSLSRKSVHLLGPEWPQK